ncbi:MAG: aminotransferase class IV [Haloarculaceae archaeon]
MSEYTYHLDGKLVPAGEATVDVRDRGFLYGDAAFETLRVYGGEIFEWESHVGRLARTCRTLGFDEAMPPAEDLRERVLETVAANVLRDAYARLSITRGVQPGKLTPDPRVAPTIVIIVDELPRGGTEGESVWAGPATLRTVERRRPPEAALPAGAKTHNYLNGILARRELRQADGATDEAIICDVDGYVTEGATSNLFFVDGGTLKTPSTSLPLLPGVTRDVVLDLAREEGLPIETGKYSVRDIREAEEVFATNTTWEVRPVTSVDGISLSVGPMTRLLARLYEERIERACYDSGDGG